MYGKIFDSIYEGTLYGHWEAIVTMQQMIVLSNSDGVVDMTPQAMSARTSIPLDIITKGLKVLSEPDPYTRTPGDEGRRIALLDDHRPWGWRLINHGKYKRLRDMDQKQEADRERMAEKRRKNKDVATGSQGVAEVAHADADADAVPTTANAVVVVAATGIPTCPHQEIIDLYHRILPSGRQVAEWNGARATLLKTRWREKRGRQSLDWWDRFFHHVEKSDFLMGRVHTPGRDPFEISLPWILESKNFLEIIEGKYNREKGR